MAQTLYYQDYLPLYDANGKRDKARRYISASTGTIISVRQFQARAHEQAQDIVFAARQEMQQKRYRSKSQREIDQLQRFYRVVNKAEYENASLTAALKSEHLSRATFNRINLERAKHPKSDIEAKYAGTVVQPNRRIEVSTIYKAQMLMPAFDDDGNVVELYAVFDQAGTRDMARYWHNMFDAVKQRKQPDASTPEQIVDTSGNIINLITDVDVFLLYIQAMGIDINDDFDEKIYKLMKGESLKTL